MKKTITILLLLAVFGLSGVVQAQIPTNGLVGYWPFNGNANDESGNGNNRIVSGATLTADRDGNANSAYNFDGVNDYMHGTTNATLNLDEFTYSCWVKMNSISGEKSIGGSYANPRGYHIRVINGVVVFRVHDGNLTSVSSREVHSATTLSINQWYNLTFTCDQNGIMLYVNGNLEDTVLFGSWNFVNQSKLRIGCASWDDIEYFGGIIDDITIYDRALLSGEVVQLYTGCNFSTSIVANSATTFCDGDNVTLESVHQGSPFTFQWLLNDSPISGETNYYYVATVSGDYSLIVDSLGCSDTSNVISITVNQNTTSSITETVCDSYTAPDGAVYTTSGIKTAVIPNAIGCDSTITINLAVNQSTAETITETACDSYTAPDGAIYTTSGVKTAVIPNAAGCDSTITINLAVNQSTAETITETACDSYTAPDGTIYTTSGVKTAVIPNAAGCDSTITINLTVNQSTAETITEIACDSYTAPDGTIYTTSGVKTAVIPNAAGCDSTITINLAVNQSTAETITETACDSYTAPDGAIYTTSGVKTAVIPNAAGCDSTITIHLTINTVDISVTNNDPILIANAYPATYQWIFCNNLLHISGATNQTFSPLANGYYACIITQNGCVDTTDCYSVTTVGIIESSFENNILVYPNPTDGLIYVEFKESVKDITLDVFDNLGRIVLTKKFENIQRIETNIEGSTGLYTIRVSDANFSKTFLVSKIN